ncbi:cation transporter [Psychromonas sp.]|uniref:cation transporter n=1 Tax=Psychromonas sp. TaxID=1884585 RepID=UPI0039E4F391
MDNPKHRVGVTEVNLVIRKLQLKGLTEFNRAKIISEIDQAVGIDNVTLDNKNGLLHIAYDVTHINLDAIKLVVVKHGAELSGGWWNHFKEGYYKFVEQNMLDNIKHKPSCCSRPPPRSTKHK